MIYEIGYECKCVVAVHKNTVTVKLCRKHYMELKGQRLSEIIFNVLSSTPEQIWNTCETLLKASKAEKERSRK